MPTINASASRTRRTREARGRRRLLSGAVLSTLIVVACGAAAAQGRTVFDGLLGSWSGSGQIRYDDGQSEGTRCTAYYSGGGERLRLAIRCRRDSTEVEIRGLLSRQGEKLAGTWEERTFNASGEASGRATADRISLSISGGAFSGSMSVAFGGSRQVVAISTQGIRMRSVNVTLGRS